MLALSEHARRQPRLYFLAVGLLTAVIITLVALPTFRPETFPYLHPPKVDTDPENMLDSKEPVRVFHNAMKREFSLNDIIVVGVVNNEHPQGVFNVESLAHVYELTEYAKTLVWQENGETRGVVVRDLIAPSTVDNIEPGGMGTVRFEWLMPKPPGDEAEALSVARKALRIPFLNNTLVSPDQKALALYIPITAKNVSYRVANKLREKIAGFGGNDEYHITGLPIAQDQFGVEMFRQMAVSAPLALLLIFLLLWMFFRNLKLIFSPLLIAVISVVFTMGLLVITGHTVHIMSSMIPIFIMPIAVLDAVHILSDFFDKYPKYHSRKETIRKVMEELSLPMFYTSLTTCAGFGSLAFTPIPPVQVFGVFIALGVFFAWILTVTLIPAYIVLLPEDSLKDFGLKAGSPDPFQGSFLARMLTKVGTVTYLRSKAIVLVTVVVSAIAVYGITRIRINDNPVKWFSSWHEIRIADRILNEKFAGTYMAYLVLTSPDEAGDPGQTRQALESRLESFPPEIRQAVQDQIKVLKEKDSKAFIESLKDFAVSRQEQAGTDEAWDDWEEVLTILDELSQEKEVFKRPEVLHYIETLQQALLDSGRVGKSNSLPDIVKTVHRELFLGEDSAFRIPETRAAVAQTLITYQNSHRPADLWHFVTPDYRKTTLWIQLKSGDNRDMNRVVSAVDEFFRQYPPPIPLSHDWFGLTYINTVWQQKMVVGMAKAFSGSFVIVLAFMVFLFRSFLWGLLCMVPLTVTIVMIYGMVGLMGKDYDMPVAVLSSLGLGLAVDYAIHFIARSRAMQAGRHGWKDVLPEVFGGPARAIARNVIVIGISFLPLLAAPLVPYQTVGALISAILLLAGVVTLLILPALIKLLETKLFTCNKGEVS